MTFRTAYVSSVKYQPFWFRFAVMAILYLGYSNSVNAPAVILSAAKDLSFSDPSQMLGMTAKGRHSAATAIACARPGIVKPNLSSLAIISLPAFSSISTIGGRTCVQAASAP